MLSIYLHNRQSRDMPANAVAQRVDGNFLYKLQEFFYLKKGDISKGTSNISWSNLLYIVFVLMLAVVVVVVTTVVGVLLVRRLWRYATRMRRKAAMRKFDSASYGGLVRCFSPSLVIEAHSPKSHRFHSASQIFELPNVNGGIPQIRISVSSDHLTPDRPSFIMSNSSALPPWTESRSLIGTTISHPPVSPASFASAFHEPAIRLGRFELAPLSASSSSLSIHTIGSFWQRVAKRHIGFTQQQQVERQRLLGQVQQQFLLDSEVPYRGVECTTVSNSVSRLSSAMGHLNENSSSHHDEDQDIDERSIAHYELSFQNGDKALTSCFRGTLTYQLRYDFIHRVLMLYVIRANRLPTTDGAPNPYVKMYCLPERRNHCKTGIFKKSADPEFNEMFSFDIPYNQLPNRMLQFTVYDFDRFTRHGLIGNVIMRDLFEKSDLYNWTEFTMQIVGSQEKNDFGDLLLYLAYSLPLRKLYVTVSKAYNLRPMDITGASDPYVKVELIYQQHRVKMRKTSIKRANLNPVYHECLEFDLLPSQVNNTNLLVQVMDWDRIGRDDLLGCCVVGRESPTKEGRQQWAQCFADVHLGSDSGSLISHSVSVDANRMNSLINECVEDGDQENKFLLDVGNIPQMMISSFDNDDNGTEGTTENGEIRRLKIAHNASMSAKTSAASAVNSQSTTDGMPRAVGVWHSIFGEVPESFRNIPKAKKK